MNLWFPNLAGGIRIRRFADDWTSATVELHVNLLTRNYVKTAFGGSMSAMTDPYFFVLVMHQLGRDYVVWDTRGEIEFLTPGRGVLIANFEVPREKAQELRESPRRGEGAGVVRDRDHGCGRHRGGTGSPRGLHPREAPRDRVRVRLTAFARQIRRVRDRRTPHVRRVNAPRRDAAQTRGLTSTSPGAAPAETVANAV